mmetsp:Transcript_15539/g.26723  ORF Transcript_15539/g.26723 Transcript_15539/m.26723 type:complete len:377 (-) Transcript_15539:58-1188(-)
MNSCQSIADRVTRRKRGCQRSPNVTAEEKISEKLDNAVRKKKKGKHLPFVEAGFNALPDDLVVRVFRLLDAYDICNVKLVSRRWRALAQSAGETWPRCAADIFRSNPGATDGQYTLYYNGDYRKPFIAYCTFHPPREYITLRCTSRRSLENHSDYKREHGAHSMQGWSAGWGGNVRTVFSKVRFNPIRSLVKVDDCTFASSSGQLHMDQAGPLGQVQLVISQVPFASAFRMSTSELQRHRFQARVDLRETPFSVASSFHGYGGSSIVTAFDRQVIMLQCSGDESCLTTMKTLDSFLLHSRLPDDGWLVQLSWCDSWEGHVRASHLDHACATCCVAGSSADLQVCSRCMTLHYCSRKCQKQDWPRHKQECGRPEPIS